MQKISFKIIEQAIANIPDDPGAWEKVLEIMNRDDFQDYWAPVKMQEDWGAMKYIKTKYQKARDVAYIAYVMASVPVYVFGYTDQETKEDDIAVFDVIDDFEMSEEDPFAPDFGVHVFFTREEAEKTLHELDAEWRATLSIHRVPFALVVSDAEGFFCPDEDPMFLLDGGDDAAFLSRDMLAAIYMASGTAIQSTMLFEIVDVFLDAQREREEALAQKFYSQEMSGHPVPLS